MKKQKEPEASILSLRENITAFTKDLKHIFETAGEKEGNADAPEGQKSNPKTKGVHKPDKS